MDEVQCIGVSKNLAFSFDLAFDLAFDSVLGIGDGVCLSSN